MKKLVSHIILVLTVLSLSACSAAQSALSQPDATSEDTISGNGSGSSQGNYEMPLIMQLALGSIKLDESSYPIEAQQAAELLPLWKAYRSLSQSDTAATQELEGLVNQIQRSMTAEQIQAIKDMNLSMQDMAVVSQMLGIETGFGGRMSSGDPSQRATAQASWGGEMGPPEGGMPMDGGGPPDGFNAQAMQTAQASGSMPGPGIGLSEPFLAALIGFIEAKVH